GDGLEADISLTVRNNGGDASGPFDITLTVSYDGGMDTYQLFSSGLDAGEEEEGQCRTIESKLNPRRSVLDVWVCLCRS
ncbi:MAG: hypothetical protein R6V15_11205, partial [Desulfotignum sp.]